MRKIKDPEFRADVLESSNLDRLGLTLTVLAGECGCTADALRKYRTGKQQPGTVILGRMAQALDRRAEALGRVTMRVSTDWLIGISARPRQ